MIARSARCLRLGQSRTTSKLSLKLIYSDKVSLRELFTVLNTYVYPYIPAGSYNGYRYRIVPSLIPLAPDEELVDWNDPREVATDPIVAIDLARQIIHSSDGVEDRN